MRSEADKKQESLSGGDKTISAAQKRFVEDHYKGIRRNRIYQVLILVIFLLTWEITARTGMINIFIFSSPVRIVNTFVQMMMDGSIFYHIGVTMFETFLSFFLVIGFGLLAAILLWWNKGLSTLLEPYLVVLNSLPKSALAPVFIVWLGNNMKTIIIAAISVALFGAILTLYSDFSSVEEDKIKLIHTLGGTKKDVLFKIIIPGNILSIINVMKVNIGLSLVGVIIGEFLAAKAGLGYLIVYGSQVFKLDWVIMSIIILCIIATGLYKLICIVESAYVKLT